MNTKYVLTSGLVLLISWMIVGCSSAPSPQNMVREQPTTTPPDLVDGPELLAPQTVTITSTDDVNIVGTLWDVEKNECPAVLLLHQWQGNRHSFEALAKRMRAKGIVVLAIDGRGFGESVKKVDGSPVTAGRSENDVTAMVGDVRSAVEFLRARKNINANKVGIIGASYGSSLALMYAVTDPKVAMVGMLSPGLDYFGHMNIFPAVKAYGQRALYAVAARDDAESAAAIDSIAKEMGPIQTSKVYVVANSGHGVELLAPPSEVEKELFTFVLYSLMLRK